MGDQPARRVPTETLVKELFQYGTKIALQASIRALLRSAKLLEHLALLMRQAEDPAASWDKMSADERRQWMIRARNALTALLQML